MAGTSLVDQFGRPLATGAWKLYPSPSTHPFDNRPKPIVRAKIYENQTPFARWEQVNYSKVVATQVTGIDAALGMKANFTVGDAWHVVYQGEDTDWGNQMEAFINETYARSCNALGEVHDWHASLRTLCRVYDVEADHGLWFDTTTGLFQVLDYSRFGTGLGWCVSEGSGLEKVMELGNAYGYNFAVGYYSGWGAYMPFYIIDDKASPFDGQRILDGIIVDRNLRLLGYRILGYNASGIMAYVDVPKEQVHFNFEAGTWPNQIRGIPELANLLDDANSVSDIKYYWSQGVMIASQKMVTRESIEGRPSMGAQETEVTVTNADGSETLKMVRVEDAPAGVVELSTRRGEKLGTLDLNRPSMEEREFIKLVETAYFHKHWPRCLIYSEDAARAGSRSVAQQVQATVRKRQLTLERSARWIVNRRIALAMERGELPRNRNLYDPYNYAFSLPGKYTVDEGNDGKMYLQMLGRGTISRGVICNDMGLREEKVLLANVRSVDNLCAEAEKLAAKYPWLPPQDALNRLDNNGNANPTPVQAAAEPDGDEEEDSNDETAQAD